jgi:hypothetical protein
MSRSTLRLAVRSTSGALAASIVLTALASTARAQQTVIAAPPPRVERVEYAGPNRALIVTGLITFGVPYVTSAIVAAESSHPGDKHLWVPVAGPWLDLANRGGCPVESTSCDAETTNKVLLIGNGVLQAAGALQLIGAFVFPEHTIGYVQASAVTPEMWISPMRLGQDSYGLGATGRF